jgi:23S rRNA pseudouridine1911/1915/1917 synthase
VARERIDFDRGDLGVRIDRVLLRHLRHRPGLTRNRIQRLIDAGAVLVDGKPITRPGARLPAGGELTIDLPDRRPRTPPQAEVLPLDIRYEDDVLLVASKPAGQVSHPAFRNSSGTLLNALLNHAAGRWTPSLVSRLDKGTSGLVLVAKSRAIHLALQRLNERNRMEKDYLAIVFGQPHARGTIDLALDRDPWDARRVTVRDRGGVPSVTVFERLRSIEIAPERTVSLVRCRLVTGRTHQIRVHLAAKGWPILGDAVYGTARKGSLEQVPDGLAIGRQALHAWRLLFPHPRHERTIDVSADLPADMQAVLAAAERLQLAAFGTSAPASSINTDASAE